MVLRLKTIELLPPLRLGRRLGHTCQGHILRRLGGTQDGLGRKHRVIEAVRIGSQGVRQEVPTGGIPHVLRLVHDIHPTHGIVRTLSVGLAACVSICCGRSCSVGIVGAPAREVAVLVRKNVVSHILFIGCASLIYYNDPRRDYLILTVKLEV